MTSFFRLNCKHYSKLVHSINKILKNLEDVIRMRRLKNKLKIMFKYIYSHITSSKFDIKKFDIKNDRRYLDFLANKYQDVINKDDIKSYFYRSFLQYKCQMYKLSFYKKLVLNFISLLAIPLFVIFLIYNSLLNKNLNTQSSDHKKTILLGFPIIRDKDLVPKPIIINYKVISMNSKKFILTLDKDVWIFLKFLLKNFTFSFYFIFKLLIKMTLYNYFCQKYTPVAIIDEAEFSFTSSILTAYLERKSILYINVMNGEKLFYIRDSFFRFSECWVWNKHYINLFKKLYAFEKQFKIGIPPRHKKLKNNKKIFKNKKILKFYWGSEGELDKEELQYILTGLHKLKEKGYKIIIRCHPSHINKNKFYRDSQYLFNDFILENAESKDIFHSLLDTYYALGTCTSVLYEADLMRKVVVINDYNNNLSALERMDYIIVKNKRYIPFSKLVKECKFR